jgi:hypothetical protein
MNIRRYFNTSLPTREESSFLKILAMVLMTVDHVGFIFFPEIAWWRIVGRLSFPLFIYQFGISVNKTKHFEKMGKNLFLFALISQPIYWLISRGVLVRLNIFFTLFMAWLVIFLCKKISKNFLKFLALTPIFILLILPYIFREFPKVDYGLYGVLLLIYFAVFIEKPLIMNFTFVLLTIGFYFIDRSFVQLFCLLAVPLFYLRIPFEKKVSNILYYAYYPIHFAVLAFIAKIISE